MDSSTDHENLYLHNGDLVIYRLAKYRNSVWQYRIRLPDNSYERKSTRMKEILDAQRLAEDRYQEIQSNSRRGLSIAKVSFKKAADEFIQNERREARNKRRNKLAWLDRITGMIENYMIPYFARYCIADIKMKDIEAYSVWYHNTWRLAQGEPQVRYVTKTNKGRVYSTPLKVETISTFRREPKASAVRTAHIILRGIFTLALRNGHISQVEMPVFQPITVPAKRRGAFSPDEVSTLLSYLEQRISRVQSGVNRDGRRLLWLFVRFHLLTGLRPGAESRLRFQDITGTGPVIISVRDGKTGPRNVLVSKKVLEIVDALKAMHPNPTPNASIWTKENGNETYSFVHQFAKVLAELGFSKDKDGNDRTLYSLRHTYITRALEQSRPVNLTWLADNCGTSVGMIEKHYCHIIHTTMIDQIPED